MLSIFCLPNCLTFSTLQIQAKPSQTNYTGLYILPSSTNYTRRGAGETGCGTGQELSELLHTLLPFHLRKIWAGHPRPRGGTGFYDFGSACGISFLVDSGKERQPERIKSRKSCN